MELRRATLRGAARRGDRPRGHVDGTTRLDEKCPTGGGKVHAAGSALEHRGAELVLQITDLLRKRRLGDTQMCRGSQETPFLGNCDEIAKVA